MTYVWAAYIQAICEFGKHMPGSGNSSKILQVSFDNFSCHLQPNVCVCNQINRMSVSSYVELLPNALMNPGPHTVLVNIDLNPHFQMFGENVLF